MYAGCSKIIIFIINKLKYMHGDGFNLIIYTSLGICKNK
jgi:hypothetical protein